MNNKNYITGCLNSYDM